LWSLQQLQSYKESFVNNEFFANDLIILFALMKIETITYMFNTKSVIYKSDAFKHR